MGVATETATLTCYKPVCTWRDETRKTSPPKLGGKIGECACNWYTGALAKAHELGLTVYRGGACVGSGGYPGVGS